MTGQNTAQIYVSLVIPCFNEEAAIPLFYEETVKTFSTTQPEKEFDFIFIDDGSTDKTLEVLQNLAKKDNRVHYISFSRNFGKEAAILAGLQAASGEYVATLDADGQDPPALIPQMLEAVESGEYDCAGTRRVTRKGEPRVRSFFARRFYALMEKITDIKILDGARDFRLFNRKYLEAVRSLPERGRFSKGIFPWVGFKTRWFEYENIERKTGKTKWSFWKLFLYSLDGITAFSSKPLTIASFMMSTLLFIAAIGFTGFIIIRKMIWGDPVRGWASLICIILFCSGIQFFITGILGQYLSKIYMEVKGRPHYIIQEAV
ncbi:MAG: glycosyltransferase family 2 protein [Treponema sp.]|jgi:glycosyltransferase involved in cell wall biosynthesis|nr:glycosyltransferase family 2 protein [Treponema sp.]